MPYGAKLSRKELRHLTPQIAEMYAVTSDRLFKRDMTKLLELNLVVESDSQYSANVQLMDAFTPRPDLGFLTPLAARHDEGED